METTYEINCINSTDENYHFVAYQTYPDTNLKSVAWEVAHVPKMEAIPSSAHITWQETYGVAIVNWKESDQIYIINQEVRADLGFLYEVQMPDDGIPVINPERKPAPNPGQIALTNKTNEKLTLGFTVSDKLMAVQEVVGRETVMFQMQPIYKVACFRGMKLQEGQILTEGVGMGRMDVQFGDGYTKCKVEAAIDDGGHYIKEPQYYAEQLSSSTTNTQRRERGLCMQ